MKNNDDNTNDEQIVSTVIKGDIESFKFIVKKYQKHIYSMGMRFFRNRDDSYDFVQEVFIKSYDKLKSFRGLSPFRHWLSKLAFNHGINKIKSGSAEDVLEDELIISAGETPETALIKNEIQKILAEEIQNLPDRYKICLDLYFYLGLSYPQISDITEIPVNTIKSNVFRAKEILRNKLKGTLAEKYHEMR